MISIQPLKRTDPETDLVADWLAKDELHQALGLKLDDVFEDGTEAVMISDERGPLIAVRLHKSLRVAMQFQPNSRLRIARSGAEVVDWMKQVAKNENCSEVIIRPGGKAKNFAEKLGFREFIGKFIKI